MDPISDMFIRIKNAQKAGHELVKIPYSKFKHDIAKALERSCYLGKTERRGKRARKILEMELLYKDENPVISGVRLLSKPSRRLYISYKNLSKPRHGGVILLTTPKGIMTDKEARKEKVGGQLLAEVW